MYWGWLMGFRARFVMGLGMYGLCMFGVTKEEIEYVNSRI